MTPLFKGQRLLVPLLLLRQGPHGVLDTSVRNRISFFS
jgi:hypothetical protein